MGIFQNLFSKGGVKVASPVNGRLVSIKKVSDPTFRDEIVGKGAAVIPSDNRICAPVDGVVSTIFPTGHAAAVTGKGGEEILIHIGLDTVKLKGKHFTIRASEGQEVKKGDLLIEADIEQIKAEGYDIITPVIVCNSDDYAEVVMNEEGDVAQGDEILTLRKA